MGAGIDPDAAFDAGEEIGGHHGRLEGGVGAEVEDDLWAFGAGALGLTGGVGIDHRLR